MCIIIFVDFLLHWVFNLSELLIIMPETDVSRHYTMLIKEKYGDTFQGRPVINTGDEIDGGVLLAGSKAKYGEATVVDWEKYRSSTDNNLQSVFKSSVSLAEKKCIQKTGEKMSPRDIPNKLLIESVYKEVNELMTYDLEFTEKVISGEIHGEEVTAKKVSLQDTYMDNRRGICRHFGLIIAVVLERMHHAGVLKGTGIVNRNFSDGDGHLWAEYVEADGRRVIMDAAQNYFGDPNGDGRDWNYNHEMSVSDLKPEAL